MSSEPPPAARAAAPAPSREQQAVIQAVARGSPLTIIDSVAGAGKTTCLLSLAAALPQCRILQITYNSALKAEVRAKVAQRGLGNMHVHTYHSLCTKHYDTSAYTDDRVYRVLHSLDPGEPLPPPIRRIPRYDIVCIDEIQDMTGLYFKLVWRFLTDMAIASDGMRGFAQTRALAAPQIVVLGDRYQGVYAFKQADTRYLTMARYVFSAPRVFGGLVAPAAAAAPPAVLRMSTSYRVTIPIANFINRYMLKGDARVRAVKPGPPVDYVREDASVSVSIVHRLIKEALADGSATPADIFVLCCSVKPQNGKNPVRMLENMLVLSDIPCFVPTSDEAPLDDAVIAGKCVITTLCQSKGRERKLVVVFGFDDSYFKFYDKKAPRDACTPGLYVGVTRAAHRLILVHVVGNRPLPFLTLDGMRADPDVRFHGNPPRPPREAAESAGSSGASSDSDDVPSARAEQLLYDHRTIVTDLTRFVKTEIFADLSDQIPRLFRCVRAPDATRTAELPPKVATEIGRCEEVADINGLAIVAMWEYRTSGRVTMDIAVRMDATKADWTRYAHRNRKASSVRRMQHLVDELPGAYREDRPADFMRLAVLYQSYRTGYYFKAAQVTRYDWISPGDLATCLDNLALALTDDPPVAYEYNLLVPEEIRGAPGKYRSDAPYVFKSEAYGDILIGGTLDALTERSVYELKCTKVLGLEHYAQVMLYAWLWSETQQKVLGPRRFYLYNVLTTEQWELTASPEQLRAFAMALLKNKYDPPEPPTDSEFVSGGLQKARGIVAASSASAAAAAGSADSSESYEASSESSDVAAGSSEPSDASD